MLDFCNIKEAVQAFFLETPRPAVKLKPARMLRITQYLRFLEIRDSYTCTWRSWMISNTHKLPTKITLQKVYPGLLPLKSGKFSDLRKPYRVLKPSSIIFYNSLGDPVSDTADVESEVELDMSDTSSGGED
ncbi:hypothetical protein PR048_010967 [Dryococelus australis]|uniref:Uncharacterized protein n=1 Tax=Dryococelus australis TaxID=614101 RepID=A0ABQ9HKB7_9NEOP|nr:hypothetical protein PR048_010967 [Dryococelus australis]